MSSRKGVHKYLTKYYFLCVYAFYHVLLGCFLLYALILLWQNMAVNLHAAHKKAYSHAAHEALLACFLLSCITRITRVQRTKIARVQYTKVDSCAAHFVSHVCFDLSHDKKWRTHACSPHTSVNLEVSCTVDSYTWIATCVATFEASKDNGLPVASAEVISKYSHIARPYCYPQGGMYQLEIIHW